MSDELKVKKTPTQAGKLGKDIKFKAKVEGVESAAGQDVISTVAGDSGAKEPKTPKFDETLGCK